ncbi:hypothetical protein GCK72_025637 [Caenorhabditis remanei]|uniref:G-protein coupled receptors family 1 profile domain-containing protein n=1 Tax=Caenorhabditis remanei TaxID=31234 RepID=A0A6A5G2I7_CAERE|nr:hypothetical protein GCK72_025637 [Caenorhabditis remanei]KAF1749170.1 hypothetical protein GCK72_025637 [Caenorhabditis remanei]
MNNKFDGCGDAHAYPNSSDFQRLAEACLQEEGSYFDGCSKVCIKDKFLMPIMRHESLESLVYGQIFPVLVLFAVFANAAVALVLSKKHMTTPTNVVLKYMAIAEVLVGLVPLPWTVFYFTMGNFKEMYRLETWWCYLHKYSMDAFPPICHNIAMWLTVLLAAQREKRSEEAARQRDSNSTSLMLVAIVSIFLIVNLPQAVFMALLCVCETFSIRLSILEGTFPVVFLITSNMIVIATYPINFGIYCFMSSSFRQTFKLIFCPGTNQLQCERRIEAPSVVHSSRRSDICSHLVNVCTNSEGFMQVSHHCLHADYIGSDRQSTQFTTINTDRSE